MDQSPATREKEIVFDFIAGHPLAVLSTASPKGEPSSAPVYTRVRPDLVCYFSTRTSAEKYLNIMQNPHVALAIVDGTTLETVQLRGIANLLSNPDEIHDVMESLRYIVDKEKHNWMSPEEKISHGAFKFDVSRLIPPIGQMEGGSYAYMQVRPSWLRYRRYDSDWKTGKKYTEYIINGAV